MLYEASIFASFFHPGAEAWRQVLADLLGTREENAGEVMTLVQLGKRMKVK